MRIEHGLPAFDAGLRPELPVPRPTERPAVPEPEVVVEIGVPRTPPAEVLERVREAAERAARLADEHNRELHFRRDEASNRVVVEVRSLEGRVIRTIPPSSALEAMTPGIWR
jgi:flagellar protein FlaG